MVGTTAADPSRVTAADRLRIGTANVCMLRLLEKVALRFNRAHVPLMVLKGAALNLTIHDRADQRPMSDLDLQIRPEHAAEAVALLEEVGCRPGQPLVREDFFPRFYHETEFVTGGLFPMRIDLHVRPLRPLPYARRVPPDALWRGATAIRVGQGEVLIPSAEDMLIHLAAHSAIHANSRPMWLRDLKHWAEAWADQIDWERFLENVRAWNLVLPVRQALDRAQESFGQVCPPDIRRRLAQNRVGWRDRLSLRQAPRDAEHPVGHVLVNVLCTPGWRFVLSYLWVMLVPGRRHMEEWYDWRHWGWLPCAHVLRVCSPLLRRIPRVWTRFARIEVRERPKRGLCVVATRDMVAGESLAGCCGDWPANRNADAPYRHAAGRKPENLMGKLAHLRHSCRPNAEPCASGLRALRRIDAGREITIDYGEDACNCRSRNPEIGELAMSA